MNADTSVSVFMWLLDGEITIISSTCDRYGCTNETTGLIDRANAQRRPDSWYGCASHAGATLETELADLLEHDHVFLEGSADLLDCPFCTDGEQHEAHCIGDGVPNETAHVETETTTCSTCMGLDVVPEVVLDDVS